MLESIFKLLFQQSWVPVIVLVSIFISVLWKIQTERHIRAIGGERAPRIPTLPFGVDFVFRSVRSLLKHRTLELWRSIFSDYGTENSPYTVEMSIGLRRYILTADHQIIKSILATQFESFGKGETFNHQWREFLGDSVFTTDGQEWHDSRQLIRPLFVNQRIGDLEIFEKYTRQVVDIVGREGKEIDLTPLFYRYTLDVATEFLFGQTVGSLEEPRVEFAAAIAEVQRVQARLARSGPLYSFIPRGQFRWGLQVINSLIQPYVDRTLRLSPEELEKHSNTSDINYTLLHALARFTRSRKKIKDELVNLLFAGRDTTAATLSWAFYELASKPAVVSRLRKEIIQEIGLDAIPSLSDLKKMKYVHHVVNETLRLHPPVPVNVRYASTDVVVTGSGGRKISLRKGDAVVYSTLAMQRRTDIYPPISASFPPPEEFVPERWESWVPEPWTYIPFNGGPRICVGQQFALTEMWFTIVRLLQKFERIDRGETQGEQFLKTDVVGSPGGGVKVKLW